MLPVLIQRSCLSRSAHPVHGVLLGVQPGRFGAPAKGRRTPSGRSRVPEAVRVGEFDSVDDPARRDHLYWAKQWQDISFPGTGPEVCVRNREGGPGERCVAKTVPDDCGHAAVLHVFWGEHRGAGPGA